VATRVAVRRVSSDGEGVSGHEGVIHVATRVAVWRVSRAVRWMSSDGEGVMTLRPPWVQHPLA
jgi:hypothetical protein